ncbi:DUF2142 domain-containing protein [Anaerolineales bacterium HSG25]|nr:DUF2142 domain-containing protein [Anaerolineales bacterium HSG25]
MTTHLRHPLTLLILLTYLGSGIMYATLTPKWQTPDEPAHYNYIRYLAQELSFPELTADCYDQAYLNQLTSQKFPAERTITPICYEYHQPPNYYLLATPVFWLSSGSLLALRLLSVLIGAGTIYLALRIAQTIYPHQSTVSYGAMAFVAFVPMHGSILASVNNDALAGFLFAALLYQLIQQLTVPNDESPPFKQDIGVAVLLGLGLLTKMTVYIAIPLVGITVWLTTPRQQWKPLLTRLSIVYGLALLIVLPWYLRNINLYGNFDIFGLQRHDQIVAGQLRTSDYIQQVGGLNYVNNILLTSFHSFWGQFGWMAVPMDGRVYWALMVLMLIALSGLVSLTIGLKTNDPGLIDLKPAKWEALALMAVIIGLVLSAYGWYNLQFVQFQGRYLFTAMIPFGLFFSLGLTSGFRRVWPSIVSLSLLLGYLLLNAWLTKQIDKWAFLLTCLPLLILVTRLALNRYRSISEQWLVGACYVGLAVLTLLAPVWFIVPNLTP